MPWALSDPQRPDPPRRPAVVALTFDVAFGIFAAAMVAIAVLVGRWAVGLNREARRHREQTGDGGEAAP